MVFFSRMGDVADARDFAFPEDVISRAKEDALDMLEEGVSDARTLLYFGSCFIEITPYSNEGALLDAWRRAYILGECAYTLPSGVYRERPLVVEPKTAPEPLAYTPPIGASRSTLAQWRRAFLAEIYVSLRDDVPVDVEPYIGWPNPGSFEPGKLTPPLEGEETHAAELVRVFIIFWAKFVQKMINEGVSFNEAALKGAQKTHLLEGNCVEARLILHFVRFRLVEMWSYAQELYDWYSSWMDNEFPREMPARITEELR